MTPYSPVSVKGGGLYYQGSAIAPLHFKPIIYDACVVCVSVPALRAALGVVAAASACSRPIPVSAEAPILYRSAA